VLRQPRFVEGNYNTNFIPETYPDGFKPMDLLEPQKHKLAATVYLMRQQLNKNNVEYHRPENISYIAKIQNEYFAVTPHEGNLVVEQID